MKKLFLVLAGAMIVSAVSAQDLEKNIFSIRGGMNIADISAKASGVSASSNSRVGYHIGITDQILLFNKLPLYLEPGIFVSSRGGKEDEGSFRPLYLQVPVVLNYKIPVSQALSIDPYVGVYYGFGIAGKIKAGDVKVDMFGDSGVFKRSDFGIKVGVGASWKRFYAGVGYEIGCLDLLKDGVSSVINGQTDGEIVDVKMRANCWTISVGYKF